MTIVLSDTFTAVVPLRYIFRIWRGNGRFLVTSNMRIIGLNREEYINTYLSRMESSSELLVSN